MPDPPATRRASLLARSSVGAPGPVVLAFVLAGCAGSSLQTVPTPIVKRSVSPNPACEGTELERDGSSLGASGRVEPFACPRFGLAALAVGEQPQLAGYRPAGEYDRKAPGHLDYMTLIEKRPQLRCERIVITHMSDEMLAHLGDADLEAAADGAVITI